jgi:hypothetical protein
MKDGENQEDLNVHGKVVLKWILDKYDGLG